MASCKEPSSSTASVQQQQQISSNSVSGTSSVSVAAAAAASTASSSSGATTASANASNRNSRFAMEGVGSRVIRGVDWKWGKQVSALDVPIPLETCENKEKFLVQEFTSH